jgi:hypothetical protein
LGFAGATALGLAAGAVFLAGGAFALTVGFDGETLLAGTFFVGSFGFFRFKDFVGGLAVFFGDVLGLAPGFRFNPLTGSQSPDAAFLKSRPPHV